MSPSSVSSGCSKRIESELLLVLYISDRVSRNRLLRAQYTNSKGRSVDTSFHSVVSWLDEVLKHKDFPVGGVGSDYLSRL